jgi:hypothetical protein
MGKHQVVAMTIVTGGSNHQSGFKQTPAMNPLGIVLDYIVLGDIIYPGHHFAFFVASSAEVGDIHLIGARFGIAVMENIMMAVTLFAAGRIGIVSQQSLSMGPSYVIGHFHSMAGSTIDRLQIIGMGKALICRINVAGNTGVAMVDTASKNGGIYKHRYSSSLKHSG